MAWVGSRVRRISDNQEGIITDTKDQQIVLKIQITLDSGEKCKAYRWAFATGNPSWQVRLDEVKEWAELDG